MHWKLKSFIQNFISLLPSDASYSTYYWVQRNFGGLKSVKPDSRLLAGIEAWKLIQSQGYDPQDKAFLEIGTGRIPLTPIAYWLMGARKVYTIDINPYVKEELIQQSLQYIAQHQDEIQALFGDELVQERFRSILKAANSQMNLSDILAMCQIDYKSPCNAANTGLLSSTVDFHTSYNVFEHIPPQTLRNILGEGNRITKHSGLFVHRIDYSDHFSHTDSNITSINFLQYSDGQWNRYAGNRYMYMNRLRHDDFVHLYKEVNHSILYVQSEFDSQAIKQLQDYHFKLDRRFSSKSEDVLTTSKAWIISHPV